MPDTESKDVCLFKYTYEMESTVLSQAACFLFVFFRSVTQAQISHLNVILSIFRMWGNRVYLSVSGAVLAKTYDLI